MEEDDQDEYQDLIQRHNANVIQDNLEPTSPFQDINVANKTVLEEIQNQTNYSEDSLYSAGALCASFGNKMELDTFMRVTCNFRMLSIGQMRQEQYGQIIGNVVKAITNEESKREKLVKIHGVSYLEDLHNICCEDSLVRQQLQQENDIDLNGNLVKKQITHTRSFQISLLCTLRYKEFYQDTQLPRLRQHNLEIKMKLPQSKITINPIVGKNFSNFETKVSKPGKISKLLTKSIMENHQLIHNKEFRKNYFLEKIGRKTRGSNLNLLKYVYQGEVKNNKIDINNMSKEHLQRIIQRQEEQLKAQDPKQQYSESFGKVMGENVDGRMNQIGRICKILDQINFMQSEHLNLLGMDEYNIERFQEFLEGLKKNVDHRLNSAEDRRYAQDQICELLKNFIR